MDRGMNLVGGIRIAFITTSAVFWELRPREFQTDFEKRDSENHKVAHSTRVDTSRSSSTVIPLTQLEPVLLRESLLERYRVSMLYEADLKHIRS
jgi:hypothetical protein